MRVVSWNVNGLRAAWSRGLAGELLRLRPDVVMLQEIRCTPDVLPADFKLPRGFRADWNPAAKKGYAGVATWTRGTNTRVSADDGRVVVTDHGGVRFVNLYAPSGSAGPESQARKDAFMLAFVPLARGFAEYPGPLLLGGDINVAPTTIDVWEPKRTAKLSGCLPHERAWFAELLALGFVDVVRERHGARPGPWSWWSNFGTAKSEDRGWRIDIVLANRAASGLIGEARIDRDAGLACSDHAPVIVEITPPG